MIIFQRLVMRAPSWIPLLLGLGGIWLLYIIISAAQSPDPAQKISPRTLKELSGYEPTFPPRRIPDYPLAPEDGPQRLIGLKGKIALIQFSSAKCAQSCTEAATALSAFEASDSLARAHISLRGHTAEAPAVPFFWLEDKIGSFEGYISASSRTPVTIVYDLSQGLEIGRFTGVIDWTDPAVLTFLRELETSTVRR